MEAAVQTFGAWIGSMSEDVEAVKALLEAEQAAPGARELAATALGYLVTRMDLIPDWNETIGVIDDAMVLRLCMDLAAERHPGWSQAGRALAPDVRDRLTGLAEGAAQVQRFLGPELSVLLRKHCARLVHAPVHGRSPAQLVASAEARLALYAEIASDLARMPAASFAEPEMVAGRLRSYLHHKLRS